MELALQGRLAPGVGVRGDGGRTDTGERETADVRGWIFALFGRRGGVGGIGGGHVPGWRWWFGMGGGVKFYYARHVTVLVLTASRPSHQRTLFCV